MIPTSIRHHCGPQHSDHEVQPIGEPDYFLGEIIAHVTVAECELASTLRLRYDLGGTINFMTTIIIYDNYIMAYQQNIL